MIYLIRNQINRLTEDDSYVEETFLVPQVDSGAPILQPLPYDAHYGLEKNEVLEKFINFSTYNQATNYLNRFLLRNNSFVGEGLWDIFQMKEGQFTDGT